MCDISYDGKGHHHKLKRRWRGHLMISNRILMPRWNKIMSISGHTWWLLFFALILLLLLFHKLSLGLRSPKPSTCHPPKPRREILTGKEEEEYEAWKEEQEKRRRRMKQFCKKEPEWNETWLNDPNIHPLMFQYNAKYSLMGCLQPKVFQSSKYNLIFHLWTRSLQPLGTNISIAWSLRADERSSGC